jgi:exosome complex RNA-binding protein Csl4
LATSVGYKQARKFVNKRVKIKTKTGAVLYGTIIKVSDKKVFLKVSGVHSKSSKAHATFFPFILPLALFDLLAIILLL